MTVRLADRTTLGVGGPADEFVLASSEAEIIECVSSLDAGGRPLLLIGGGSNIVCGDSGFAGTVIAIGNRGLKVRTDGDAVEISAAAGEPWDELVAHAAGAGWAGIEALSGIPGLVGATPIQNVGAYGQEVSQTILGVRALDRRSGHVIELGAGECAFTYRGSAFKAEPDRWVVLEVTFRFATDVESVVRYSQLAEALGQQNGERASAQRIREAVLALRADKGMVLDPDDPDTCSAGSFFTNPIVSDDAAARLPGECPRYPAVNGVKVSAAWLIEHAGVTRGWRARPGSRAAVSSKHALAISNLGGATAAEVIELARAVRERVHSAYGVELSAEPRFVNCTLGPIGR